MTLKLSNNGLSTLATGISAADTSVQLAPGEGARFPALGAGDFFPLTIVQSNTIFEILLVTARAGDVLTVARAQEGTTARAFNAGTRVELRLTASAVDTKLDKAGGSISGGLDVAGALTHAGKTVYDTGNFNPANYQPLATAWNTSNFDPKNVTGPVNVAGRLNASSDLKAHRNNNTGALFLGSSENAYLYYDGGNYTLGGSGDLYNVRGRLVGAGEMNEFVNQIRQVDAGLQWPTANATGDYNSWGAPYGSFVRGVYYVDANGSWHYPRAYYCFYIQQYRPNYGWLTIY